MRVTVFGGSQPRPGDAAYAQALQLGSRLGEAGHTVLTGGYIGTMEAVSRGASEAGGHVVGVTCDEIEAWRPVGPNRWVAEEWRFPTVRERLFALIEACDAAIALPGGAGTLTEIAVMWTQFQTRALSPRPLVLVGEGWQSVFRQLFDSLGRYIDEQDRELLTFVSDVSGAVAALPASGLPR